jgi:hypothetical protein
MTVTPLQKTRKRYVVNALYDVLFQTRRRRAQIGTHVRDPGKNTTTQTGKDLPPNLG